MVYILTDSAAWVTVLRSTAPLHFFPSVVDVVLLLLFNGFGFYLTCDVSLL